MKPTLISGYAHALHAIADAGGVEGDALKAIQCLWDPAEPAARLSAAVVAAALHERGRRGYARSWDAPAEERLTALHFPEGVRTIESLEAAHASTPLLVLERDHQEREQLLYIYTQRLSAATGGDRGSVQPLVYVLSELSANIWDHAETELGFIIAGVSRRELVLAVVDSGISIPLSYARTALSIGSDLAALEAALTGTSARPQGGRGYGLRTVTKLVTDGWGGSLLLASRTALIYTASGAIKERCDNLPYSWSGTIVAASIPLPLRSVDLYAYVER